MGRKQSCGTGRISARTRQSLFSPFLKELNTLGVLSGKVFFRDLGQFAEFLPGAELNEDGAGLDEYRVSRGHVVDLNICKWGAWRMKISNLWTVLTSEHTINKRKWLLTIFS